MTKATRSLLNIAFLLMLLQKDAHAKILDDINEAIETSTFPVNETPQLNSLVTQTAGV